MIKLTKEFKENLDLLETGEDHLFITGKAGTGKTTLLRLFIKSTKKQVVVLAPTGVAALNAGGQTIHSFFKFPPSIMEPSQIRRVRNAKIYKKLDILVIDEASMVRADLLDNIDHFLRINRDRPEKPFGGVRLILFGDLFQIPPVIRREDAAVLGNMGYRGPYFFNSWVFRDGLYMCLLELTTIFRQNDGPFINILNQIREGESDYDLLELLNKRHTTQEPPRPFITVTAYNRTAEKINQQRLAELNEVSRTYTGKMDGQFKENLAPTPVLLDLKEGAQVMILINDVDLEYANGTIGTIVKIEDDRVHVKITSEKTKSEKVIKLGRHTWELKKYKTDSNQKIETEVIGTFKQFPIRLSWAITIHKSQGKTFERILIDLGKGAFAPGQTYVALSRCTTLEGIYLRQPLKPKDIIVDPKLVEAYEDMKRR